MMKYNDFDPISEILKRVGNNLSSEAPRYDLALDDAISILRIAHHLNTAHGPVDFITLRAKVKALEADSKRLEFMLRNAPVDISHIVHPSPHRGVIGYTLIYRRCTLKYTRHDGRPALFMEDTPRAAIDAAMADEQRKETSEARRVLEVPE
jgi:hypothetical protein